MPNKEPFPDNHEHLEIIEVVQDEWKDAGPGSILTTRGVDPCIVIAIYNPGKGAVLGHFSDPMNTHLKKTVKSFDTLMDLLAMTPDDISQMIFWIGGGSSLHTEDDIYTEQIDANVDYMLEKIKQLGADENNIDFGLSGHYEEMEVQINSENGAITVGSARLPEDPTGNTL